MAETLENTAIQLLYRTLEERSSQPEIADRLRAEVRHGFDVLRWVKWLEPNASLQLRLAALLHDFERLKNFQANDGFKGDRTSEEYKEYKDQHAQRSTDLVVGEFAKRGIDQELIGGTATLIQLHDFTHKDMKSINNRELEILISADSFAFFTSVADEFYEREGEEQLRQKIIFMIRKTPPYFRKKLAQLNFTDRKFRIEPEFAVILERIKTEVLKNN